MISGTPGRVLDLLLKKIIDLNSLKILIIDEIDEILMSNLKYQIFDILNFTQNV